MSKTYRCKVDGSGHIFIPGELRKAMNIVDGVSYVNLTLLKSKAVKVEKDLRLAKLADYCTELVNVFSSMDKKRQMFICDLDKVISSTSTDALCSEIPANLNQYILSYESPEIISPAYPLDIYINGAKYYVDGVFRIRDKNRDILGAVVVTHDCNGSYPKDFGWNGLPSLFSDCISDKIR